MLHALAWGEAGLRLAAAHVKGLAMHATGLHLRATLATFAAGRDVEAGELQGFPEAIRAISQFEAGGPAIDVKRKQGSTPSTQRFRKMRFQVLEC